VEEYEAALRAVSYVNHSQDPNGDAVRAAVVAVTGPRGQSPAVTRDVRVSPVWLERWVAPRIGV